MEETKYLGYQLGRGEVQSQVIKIEAIYSCPRPRTNKEARSFLGLVSLYGRFVPQLATIALLKAKDQRNLVTWNEDCKTAFQTLKTLLVLFSSPEEC